ncbi:TPA: hypothetical protein EYO12_03005 [Candidatus Saccharibacteria bacterium]|nr:hypothetical protein [Candidatus Saccharibacteria bacterium]HIO87996.1 hypothetical protein [Candidatus Saccharibacteria bacterium]
MLFVMRHGKYEHDPERLTPEGKRQAEVAADTIKTKLGRGIILIASSAPRATETGEIVAEKLNLDAEHFMRNKKLNAYGNHPEGCGSFEDMLSTILEEAEVELDMDSMTTREADDVLLVAHAPLVAATMGYHFEESYRVPYCLPVEYDPDVWQTPELW